MQAERTCSVEDCGLRVMARGWCRKHYERWSRTGDPLKVRKPGRTPVGVCSIEGCGREYEGNGYCHPHNWRFKRYGDPQAAKPVRAWRNQQGCLVENCEGRYYARGWCGRHYQAWRIYGDPTKQVYASPGQALHYRSGYRAIHVNGRIVLEHRHVMEQMLGRPLLPEENVHHKNGRRADNRPENLELWVGLGSQPKGARAADLLAWAEEIVARYGPERDLL
jgi:hypothetical protein